MRISTLATRVLRLEQNSGSGCIALRFGDGSTRSVRVRDVLGLLLAAWRRRSATLGGLAIEPNITLDLIGSAEGIVATNDPLIQVLFESTQDERGVPNE